MHRRHHIFTFIDALKQYKGDDEMLTLYAASLIVRTKYTSGAILNPTVEKIMKLLHVGRNRAKWFLTEAKQSIFFRYDEQKDILSVVSNRKLFARKRIDQHGRVIYCAPVRQINLDKEYTLAKMKAELRATLLEDAIRSSKRFDNESTKDGYKFLGRNNTFSPCRKCGQYLSLRTIAKVTGLKHLTQAKRLVSRLIKEGVISSERQMMVKLSDSDEPRDGFYWGGWTHQLFVSIPNKLRIVSNDVLISFRHVIFNYGMGLKKTAEPSYYDSNYNRPKSYCTRNEQHPY